MSPVWARLVQAPGRFCNQHIVVTGGTAIRSAAIGLAAGEQYQSRMYGAGVHVEATLAGARRRGLALLLRGEYKGAHGSDGVKPVLFYRDFQMFTGGHLKVWHYFNHVRRSGTHWPHIRFTAESVWDETNPWWPLRDEVLHSWRHIVPDVLFLEGLDWRRLGGAARERSPVPVLNLIQGVRHADPARERYSFLGYKAVRICVSEEVKQAILATDRVNGPVFVIRNGLDLPALPPPGEADCDVLIAGLKNRDFGVQLRERILAAAGRDGEALGSTRRRFGRTRLRIEVLTRELPRETFLRDLQRARVGVFLPRVSEGFYLPALEAMALGTLVVCPDVGGNRSFCLPAHNCFRPEYTLDAIARATAEALALSPQDRVAMLEKARETARDHQIERERAEFLAILRNLGDIW